MSIKIDKNMPITAIANNGRAVYPWKQMEVGDSFFVASDGTRSHKWCGVSLEG